MIGRERSDKGEKENGLTVLAIYIGSFDIICQV